MGIRMLPKMKKIFTIFLILLLVTACTNKNHIDLTHSDDEILSQIDMINPMLIQSEENEEYNIENKIVEENQASNIVNEKLWVSDSLTEQGIFWLGMTIEEAAQAFKENDLTPKAYLYDKTDEYGAELWDDGTYSMRSTGWELHNFVFNENRIMTKIRIMTPPHPTEEDLDEVRMTTAKGIGIGDSFIKIEEMYGKPGRIDNESDRRLVSYHYKLGENYYLIFMANGAPDVVDAIEYSLIEGI